MIGQSQGGVGHETDRQRRSKQRGKGGGGKKRRGRELRPRRDGQPTGRWSAKATWAATNVRVGTESS